MVGICAGGSWPEAVHSPYILLHHSLAGSVRRLSVSGTHDWHAFLQCRLPVSPGFCACVSDPGCPRQRADRPALWTLKRPKHLDATQAAAGHPDPLVWQRSRHLFAVRLFVVPSRLACPIAPGCPRQRGDRQSHIWTLKRPEHFDATQAAAGHPDPLGQRTHDWHAFLQRRLPVSPGFCACVSDPGCPRQRGKRPSHSCTPSVPRTCTRPRLRQDTLILWGSGRHGLRGILRT